MNLDSPKIRANLFILFTIIIRHEFSILPHYFNKKVSNYPNALEKSMKQKYLIYQYLYYITIHYHY